MTKHMKKKKNQRAEDLQNQNKKKSQDLQKKLSGKHTKSGHNKSGSIIGRNPFTTFAQGLFNTSTTYRQDIEVLDIPDKKYWANPNALSLSDLLAGGGVSKGGGASRTVQESLDKPKQLLQPTPNILEPNIDLVIDELIKGRGNKSEAPQDSRRKTAYYIDQLLKQANTPGIKEELENLQKEGEITLQQLNPFKQAFQPLKLRIPGNLGDQRFRGDIRLPRTVKFKWWDILKKGRVPHIPDLDIRTFPPAGGPEQRDPCIVTLPDGTQINICKNRVIKIKGKI